MKKGIITMNNNLLFLNIGIKNQPGKKRTALRVYFTLGIIGALLLLGSKIIFYLQKTGFAHNSINTIAKLGVLYVSFQFLGVIF